MEKEIWKPIKNYEGSYEVSNMGKVRRLGLNKGYKGMTYKKRCELAIEKIESYRNILWTEYDEELLNILKGSDKE